MCARFRAENIGFKEGCSCRKLNQGLFFGVPCAQSVAMNIPPDMQQGSDNAVFTNVQPPSVRWQRADFIHSFCPEATAVDEAICSFISEALYNSGTEAVHTGVVMLC